MANRINQSREQYNSTYFTFTIIVHEPILGRCPSFLTPKNFRKPSQFALSCPVVTIIYIVTRINIIIIIIVIFCLSTIITFITLPIKKLQTNNGHNSIDLVLSSNLQLLTHFSPMSHYYTS